MGVRVLDVCLAFLALYVVGRLVRKRGLPLPPGPPGWPLIGNLLDFPIHAPYKTFRVMSQKYGPIFSFNVLGTRYVILNSLETCKEILEKESAVTSNRPRLTMAGDLVGWNESTVLVQYGDIFRKHRKFLHQQIGVKSNLEVFYSAQEKEAKQFVCNMLRKPDNLDAHSRRMASSVILGISHGYCVEGDGDPLVEMADQAMQIFSVVGTPGRYLVDAFPILQYLPEWFPGGGFHKDAKRWREIVTRTADTPHQFVLEHLAKGDALPSLTSQLLQEGVAPGEEDILKWASFSMYVGGSETTSITLSGFFLAMIMFPEVFKKGRVELDSVVGSTRLPTMRDRDALPYINAICTELFRWNGVSTIASHVATEDVTYRGLLIPRGSVLLGNIWHILSDPDTYPDPDMFEPERFLGENRQPDPREAAFGWGRRACPGVLLAESTIFICVAMTLATLDISRYVENGVELVPTHDVGEGMIRRVKPFKCKIAPRSETAEVFLHAR